MSTKPHPDIPTIKRGVYVHAKSNDKYEVLGVALHSETLEPLVLYRPLYQSKYEFFARPYEMFTDLVVIDGVEQPRFYFESSTLNT